MSEYNFQEPMTRFLLDKSVREAVYSNDRDMQVKLGLPLEDVERLSQLDPRRVEFFANTVEHKHINNLTRHLSFTGKIMGEKIHELSHNYYAKGLVSNSIEIQHCYDFALYLNELIDAESLPFYTKDVLDYEIHVMKLLIKVINQPRDIESIVLSENILSQSSNIAEVLELKPKSSPYLHIFQLESNIFDVLRKLNKNQNPIATEKCITFVLAYINSTDNVERIVISSSTVNFIEECRGDKSLKQIVKNLMEAQGLRLNSHNFINAQRECINLCQELCKLGIMQILQPEKV